MAVKTSHIAYIQSKILKKNNNPKLDVAIVPVCSSVQSSFCASSPSCFFSQGQQNLVNNILVCWQASKTNIPLNRFIEPTFAFAAPWHQHDLANPYSLFQNKVISGHTKIVS